MQYKKNLNVKSTHIDSAKNQGSLCKPLITYQFIYFNIVADELPSAPKSRYKLAFKIQYTLYSYLPF